MRAALILMLTLSACLEVIEHTPDGSCTTDEDCPCGQDCSVRDAGIPLCGPRLTHSCTANHECPVSHPHCAPLTRDGGTCGFLVCQ